MKLLAIAAVAAFSTPAFAQTNSAEPAPDHAAESPVEAVATAPVVAPAVAVVETAAEQPGGKIIIYRPSAVVGFGVACPVRYKGQEIVELGRGKYAEWAVPAGTYILTNKTASVEVTVADGQTKYVRCQIKTGFLSGRADLQTVDRESFAEHQANYERKDVAPTDLAAN